MRIYFAAISVLLLLAYVATTAAAPEAHAFPAAARTGSMFDDTPIKHVVIIYQENHSFDDVLGGVCQTRSNPCNGYTGPVTFADGVVAPNVVQPDVVPTVQHTPQAQKNGQLDKWDKIVGCEDAPHMCVSHVDPDHIKNLAKLADTFAVSDATFAAGKSASFGAHVTLTAGTFDGFTGENPHPSKKGGTPHAGWGCPSHKDVPWGKVGHRQQVPTCVPGKDGKGPYRKSPVPYTTTIMQRMEMHKLTWHIYQGAPRDKPDVNIWSVCPYFNWCYANRFSLQYDSSTDDFVAAAQAGRLPNLSLVLPAYGVAQHNAGSMTVGDNYIGKIVGSVENGPNWDSTAIFITYDDCGCFYDHVNPPVHLGLRNPMVIISPWARPAYTDSNVAIQPYSMLSFVQNNFGLRPFRDEVTDAYDYSESFDFHQRPLVGPRMTTTGIPRSERAELAILLPTMEDDPT